MTNPERAVQSVTPVATDSILESISDGVFTVDLEWRISSFNRAAEEITGFPARAPSGARAPRYSVPACARPSAPSDTPWRPAPRS